MAKHLTCEAKNQLVGKLSVTPEKADELLGTGLTVEDSIYLDVVRWALANTAAKTQVLLYGKV